MAGQIFFGGLVTAKLLPLKPPQQVAHVGYDSIECIRG